MQQHTATKPLIGDRPVSDMRYPIGTSAVGLLFVVSPLIARKQTLCLNGYMQQTPTGRGKIHSLQMLLGGHDLWRVRPPSCRPAVGWGHFTLPCSVSSPGSRASPLAVRPGVFGVNHG